MKTFPKTNKLVDEIKEAMIFLTNFQDGNFEDGDMMYAKDVSKSLINVDAEEIRTEIVENMLDENDQKTIDRAKMILNRVELETLDIKVFREILSVEHHEEVKLPPYIWDCYGFLYGTCIGVRNKYYEILEMYGLKNNYPKNGFLCPYELEDVHEEDVANKQVKPQEQQKESVIKEPTNKDNVLGELENNAKVEEIYNKIESYFKPDLKGFISLTSRNYLKEYLVPQLIERAEGNKKPFAELACIMYCSDKRTGKLSSDYKTFAKWYRFLCDIFADKELFTNNYSQRKFKNTDLSSYSYMGNVDFNRK